MAITKLGPWHWGDLSSTEMRAKAATHIQQALVLDPSLAEAHAAAGFLRRMSVDQWNHWNLGEALTHFERAIQINPNYAAAYDGMAWLLRYQLGRYAEAMAAIETALRLDPLSIMARTFYVGGLIY
jgi:tetratricopeptide (TPR) repeat protein